MSGYVNSYTELVKIEEEKFEALLEADSLNFFEKISAQSYSKYLGRYYYNKSLSSVYENKIIVVPKNGYITQRLVYINPELTGGTKVGVQAINITEQDGSIQLRDSGAVNFCPLQRFFDSLCYAFGIKVDYSKVDVFSLCDSVLSNFEFVYNRETGHHININSANFNDVYVLYIVEDGKTYFDEDLVQSFANTMYEAGWFSQKMTYKNIEYNAGEVVPLSVNKPSYYQFLQYCKLYDTVRYEERKPISHVADKIWACAMSARPDQINDSTLIKVSLSSTPLNTSNGEVQINFTFINLSTVPTFTYSGFGYKDLYYIFEFTNPARIDGYNTTVWYNYETGNVRYTNTTALGSQYSPVSVINYSLYEETMKYTSASDGFASEIINIFKDEISVSDIDGITIIDEAKIPTNIDSLSTDYPTWFSRLKNIVGTAVENVGESLRNVFKVIEFVPLTLIGGNLSLTQYDIHTGEVLLPNLVPTLPEYPVTYLTPLPDTDEPIPPDEPYTPTTPTPPPTTPPTIGGITPPTPDPPVMTSGNGLFTVYNPTQEQLNAFGGYLWGEDIVGILQSIFQNPMQAIISLHVIYATPETGEEIPIRLGYMTSTVNAKEVTSQYIQIDCGTVDVPEYYGSALDYAPYTKAHIYLPFIGMRELNVNEIMGTQVNVKYSIDVLTGTVYASISVFHNALSQVLYTFEGNCAVQLPLTGGDVSRLLSGMITGIALGASRGGIAGAVIGTATGAMASGGLSVSKSGSIGANAGAMGIKKPYIIITHNQPYMANNYNKQHGYPANISVQLSSCKGYTRVKDVHVENISVATQEEKKLIETLLKQGIVIN